MVVVLDRSGKSSITPIAALKRQRNEALPGFESIANAMTANESGLGQFQSATGSSYAGSLLADSTIERRGSRCAESFGIHLRRSPLGNCRIWCWRFLTALVAAFVLERHVQRRSRGIARVTEDLSAIAKGELDRRIILQSSDDARGIADNINVVTERLRAQIAREEESRQFESFVRLSAMLTHDLKECDRRTVADCRQHGEAFRQSSVSHRRFERSHECD